MMHNPGATCLPGLHLRRILLIVCIPCLYWGCSEESSPPRQSAPKPLPAASSNSYEALVARLQSSSPMTRSGAITEMLGHGDRITETVGHLRPLVRDPNVAVRVTAIESLGRIMGRAVEALPDILDALQDNTIEVRVTAAASLILIDPSQAGRVIPVLVEGLQVENPAVRIATLRTLSGMGTAAVETVSEIEKLLWDSSPDVRAAAKRALERLAAAS